MQGQLIEMTLEPTADWPEPPALHPDEATPSARQAARRSYHALRTWHPAVEPIDAETFWLIFREGVNWLATTSATISPSLQLASELIVMLGQSREARPDVETTLRLARELIEDESLPLLDGWSAVSAARFDALRAAIRGLP